MATFYNPKIVTDELVLYFDLGNTSKNTTINTSTNFLQNSSFAGGQGVPYESGSVPTNEIVQLANPGDSPYVLRQNGNNAEYQMNIDGGAQGSLSSSTQYVMSGWYAKSADYNGSDTMFHARAFSSSGANITIDTGIGTLLYSITINGLIWQYRYQSFTTPADYTNNFDWYLGYGTNNTAGYRYYTGLRVEEGTFPSLPDLARNGNEGKVYGATYDNGNSGSLSFDGVNDYVLIPDIPQVTDFSTSDNYSIDFWVYLEETQADTRNSDNNVVEKWSGSGAYPYVFRYFRSTQTMRTAVYNGSSSNLVDISISHSNWWNVCGVFDWSNLLLTVYGNGGLVSNSTALNLTGNITNDSSLNLMRRGNSLNYATGKISSLKIYNKALSYNEIQQNFEATRWRYAI